MTLTVDPALQRVRMEVWRALEGVVDPELDESLTALGFIERVDVDGSGVVDIRLRLPTFWCSPSFAYLMANDAREAALRVGGVRDVRLELCDHGQSDEITDGVSKGRRFEEVFPDETDGSLEELRAVFRAKAFGMRQEQLVRALLGAGLTSPEIVGLRATDVVDTSDATGLRLRVGGHERLVRGAAPLARMYLTRRARFAWRTDALVTNEAGEPLAAHDLEAHLQRTRRQRVSMTFNASLCRGLLETRYGPDVSRREDSTQ